MTTSVKVLIEGNKACMVFIVDAPDAPGRDETIVKPGAFTTKLISGEQTVRVVETGDFVS